MGISSRKPIQDERILPDRQSPTATHDPRNIATRAAVAATRILVPKEEIRVEKGSDGIKNLESLPDLNQPKGFVAATTRFSANRLELRSFDSTAEINRVQARFS